MIEGERSLAVFLVRSVVRIVDHLPVVWSDHRIRAEALAADVADRYIDTVTVCGMRDLK